MYYGNNDVAHVFALIPRKMDMALAMRIVGQEIGERDKTTRTSIK